MTFLAPWFLLGLLAVGIPLLLHLRRSRRATRIVFSTTQFFDEQFIRSSRRARIQDLLLLILRMLLLAAFALALAQPLIRSPGLSKILGFAGGARQVAIVIDDSASMAAASERGPLVQRARDGALSVIEELSTMRGDRVTLVLAGLRENGPRVLFEEPTTDLTAAADAIREVELTDLATDVDAAVAAASKALGRGASGGREIYVFSDLQESALRASEAVDLGPETGVLLVSTRPQQSPGNLSVDAIQYGAARPMVGVPFSFRVMVSNHGPAARTARVRFVLGEGDAGQVLSEKPIDLPPGRSQIVRFTHRFTEAGWFGGKVEISPADDAGDAMAADNRRYFAAAVQDRIRVLAINGAPSHVRSADELFFMRLALSVQPSAAVGPLDLQTGEAPVIVDQITPVEIAPGRLAEYPMVVMANVANLSPAGLEALEQYVDQGGNLLITLGDRVRPDIYNDWIGEHRLHGGLLPAELDGVTGEGADAGGPLPDVDGNGDHVTSIDETHPALAGFGAGGLGSLTPVRFHRRFELSPRDAEVLLRGEGGEPVLLEGRFGRGRVMLLATSIDRDWTNFPLQPTYVPWVYRMVGYLSQQGMRQGSFVATGAVVTLPSSATESHAWQVRLPGTEDDVAYGEPDPTAAEPGTVVFTQTERAGVYEVRPSTASRSDPPRLMFAANIPAGESRTDYLGEPDVEAVVAERTAAVFIDSPEQVAAAGSLARQGYGVWDGLLWLALIVALVEPWIANLLSRRRASRASDALAQRDELPNVQRPATAA